MRLRRAKLDYTPIFRFGPSDHTSWLTARNVEADPDESGIDGEVPLPPATNFHLKFLPFREGEFLVELERSLFIGGYGPPMPGGCRAGSQ